MFFNWFLFLSFNRLAVVIFIQSGLEIFTCMSSSALLSCFGTGNSLSSIQYQVLQFKSFYKISVPDQTAVQYLEVSHILVYLSDFLDTFLEHITSSEDSSIVLHGLLHSKSKFSSSCVSISMSQFVQVSNRELTSISAERSDFFTRSVFFGDGVSTCATKHHQIKE